MTTLPKVNLGCGSRFHPDWVNMDMAPSGPGVIVQDIRRGIPMPNDSCQVVYHSHMLEHLTRSEALSFLMECRRVLRPLGIMRLATPDLERIIRLYLQKLEMVRQGDQAAGADYEWLLLELFDQMTREQSGGDMRAYLHRSAIPNKDFICERIGEVGRQIMTASQRPLETSFPLRPSLVNRAVKWALRPRQVVRWLAIRFLLLPEDRRALEIGSFRRSGEVHHWLYDSHSLSQIVLEAGFGPPVVQSATTSQIPNWATYGLDSNAEGVIYKPDSIFMEAVKPG